MLTGDQRWTAEDRSGNKIDTQFNGVVGNLGVQAEGPEQVYFVSSCKSPTTHVTLDISDFAPKWVRLAPNGTNLGIIYI